MANNIFYLDTMVCPFHHIYLRFGAATYNSMWAVTGNKNDGLINYPVNCGALHVACISKHATGYA